MEEHCLLVSLAQLPFFKIYLLFFIYVILCEASLVYVHNIHAGACGRQRAVSPLELKLQAVESHLIWMLELNLNWLGTGPSASTKYS